MFVRVGYPSDESVIFLDPIGQRFWRQQAIDWQHYSARRSSDGHYCHRYVTALQIHLGSMWL